MTKPDAGQGDGALSVVPIGWVRSPSGKIDDDDWGEIVSSIILDKKRFDGEALLGLASFSHVEIVYVFDRVDSQNIVSGSRNPRGNPRWPKVGIFAQRAKTRPNQIGVTVCALVSLDPSSPSMTVRGLDAFDGSPILDIKPYMVEFAPKAELISQPEWSHELMAGYWTRALPDSHDKPTARPTQIASEVGRSYDRIAGHYAEQFEHELDTKALDRGILDTFLTLLHGQSSKSEQLLIGDFGCGPGHIGGYLKSKTKAVDILGVDVSQQMCSIAAKVNPLGSLQASMAHLPIASGRLDGVVSFYAVIHLGTDGRGDAYFECSRVIKPGGYLLISFHISERGQALHQSVERNEWWGEPVSLTFHFLDPTVEVERARKCGLEEIARLIREPNETGEHQSRRAYVLFKKPAVIS